MSYEVLARKWRPKQFADVIGQEHVTRTLVNAIEAGRVAHAYLFVGPRGVGKTSTARILAKALNCRRGPTPTPCDECESCREITAGRSLDVMEIDGASNNNVEQVRDLRENARFAPARGPSKIYIIDEIHMLSAAAFNALLKTLEEPPAHVKFIFATTEPQKIPATILSRCQRFDLRRIPLRALVDQLGVIAQAEGIQIEPGALAAIARLSEGGVRDSESALDQLIAFKGRIIGEADVLAVFGLLSRQSISDLAGAIQGGELPAALARVAQFDDAGKDLQRVTLELLEYFRDLLVYLHAGDAAQLDLLPEQLAVVRAQAGRSDAGRVLRIVEILMETEGRLRFALSRRTLLETALIRCCRVAAVVSLDELLRQVALLRQEMAGGEPAPAAGTPTAAVREASPPAYAAGSLPAAKPAAPPVRPAAAAVETGGDEVSILQNRWAEVIERVGKVVSLSRSYLKDARPVAVTAEKVRVGFDPEFRENIEFLDTVQTRKVIQKALADILGRPLSLEFVVLADERSGAEEDAEAGGEADLPAGGGKKAEPTRTLQEWQRDPKVRQALEIFNGRIVNIRE